MMAISQRRIMFMAILRGIPIGSCRPCSGLCRAPRCGAVTLGIVLLAMASTGGNVSLASTTRTVETATTLRQLVVEADERILALDPHDAAAIADLGRLGVELILVNCGENPTDEATLKKGIGMVEKALALGLPAKGDVFNALGGGYASFAFGQDLPAPSGSI